jgi:hypothetical protein
MRHLEIVGRNFLLSFLLLNSEDGGAQESSEEELRKHNEDDLRAQGNAKYSVRKRSREFKLFGSAIAVTRYREEIKEIRYTTGKGHARSGDLAVIAANPGCNCQVEFKVRDHGQIMLLDHDMKTIWKSMA